MARFSDYPIQNPGPDEVYFDFFPAKFVTKYLEDYVDNHVYAGKSLRERIEFNATVQKCPAKPGHGPLDSLDGQAIYTFDPKAHDLCGANVHSEYAITSRS